jgi:hypothetical protein
MRLPMVDATAGWSASVVDMVSFITNLDGSRGQSVLSETSRRFMLEPPPRPLRPRPNGSCFVVSWDSVVKKDNTFTYTKGRQLPGNGDVHGAAADGRELGPSLQSLHGV